MMRSLSREISKLTRTARSDRQVLRRAIGASDLHLPHRQPIQLQQCSGQAVTAGQMEQGSFYCNAQVKRQFCKIVGGVIVPPRADAVLSATADTDPTQRDCHIQVIADKGRMAWQRDSGYNQRAGVEGQFARWKQVIGDGLRFHSDEARATEVAIAAQVLNRMLDLGSPNSVRVA